ncbi:MAG TPA: 1-deoxy-D-xylulose-5-phosphate synthase [Fimbriimonas sp.]|nr:1-deoxy-D-xylulose-5-phosphate synthase [Fimbriimonas sp.]
MNQAFAHLSQIVNPADLHRLSDKELGELANEVRNAILQHVSKTGGHLSSNLGTVELTVALYAAFTIPPDKVIWDTGHQAYPHKLLTGRLERFDTLRKHKGLSGFLRRSEHELDHFGAGHAGTAISAALGFAVARDQAGTNERVAAVTGDASIASGMSWEALNHGGELRTDLTVVLNDNRMSIAPNVGALTNYLATLRSRPLLQNLAHRAKDVVHRMPDPITKVAKGLRHGITHYLAPEPTGTIFEEMGWEYIGPVDGHDLPTLLEIFRNVRELHGPVFVHAITVKGKGLQCAEDDARKWHGVTPFDLDAQQLVKAAGPVTYTQAFGDAAVECAKNNDKVVAITAAMPDGTGLTKFAAEFPERYYDVGIAEQHAVTFAAGLAAGGVIPLCAIYSTFLQRAFDQVLHDVAIQNLPVRFFLDRAGLVGDDGPTHHGAFDLSYLLPIPNLVVLAPRDTTELREMTMWMAGYSDHPTVVRYPRGASDDRLPESRTPIQFGQLEILRTAKEEAPKFVLCAIGSMVSVAWEAAQRLEAMGVETDVLNARFAKPIDEAAILQAARHSMGVVTIEENVVPGGFGERVRECLAKNELGHVPVKTMGIPDAFIEHGAQPILRDEVGLNPAGVVQSVLDLKVDSAGKPVIR